MRHLAVVLALATVLSPFPASGRHVPPELAFLHDLERVRVDNTCRDPFTKEAAVCVFYVDRILNAHYRIVFRELNFSSAWRMEGGLWRIIWPRVPDCREEICT